MKTSALAIALAVTLATTAATAAPAASTATATDTAEIDAVRTKFDAAIRNQDLPALQSLFYDGKITWLATGVPSSRAFAEKQSGKPVPAVEAQGADKLIGRPEFKALRLAEHFGPATIVSDGQLATVTFDYDFRVNDQVQNWGSESWQMAKTDDGWKIVNLMFSYTFQAIAPKPASHRSK